MSRIDKKVKKKFATAVLKQNLIQENDHILVAVSGGKDSLLLLTLLAEGRKRLPISYTITACHLKNELTTPAIKEETAHYLEDYFQKLDVPYIIQDLPVIQKSAKNKPISCFWCLWLRRKTLFDIAKQNKIKKLALGHHKDDINETLLLNLFYHGRIATMPIKLSLFKGDLILIRPLAYILEKEIKTTVHHLGLTPYTCLCQFSGKTKRDQIKTIIQQLEEPFPQIKKNLFSALNYQKIDPEYLF